MFAATFVLILMLLLATVYLSATEKTLSRPWVPFALGQVLCFVSALMLANIDVLHFLRQQEAFAKPIGDMVSFALAALGGGLIAMGYSQRARILHVRGLAALRRELAARREFQAENARLLEQTDTTVSSARGAPPADKLIYAAHRYARQVAELQAEIEKREPAA